MFEPTGLLARIIKIANAFRGSADTHTDIGTDLKTEHLALLAAVSGYDYATQAAIGQFSQSNDAQLSSFDALAASAKSQAELLLIETAKAFGGLEDTSVDASLPILIAAMIGLGQYVDPNAVACSVAHGSNAGNGIVVASIKDGLGRDSQNVLAEEIAVVFSDASSTSATAEFTGEYAVEPLSPEWPKGSGASLAVAAQGVSDSLLDNADFEDFTVANTPDDWTISVGTPGTTIYSEASLVYAGAKALRFLGNSAENTLIYQALDTATLSSKQPYVLAVSVRVSSVPAAGVLTIDLHDGSGTINDESANANSLAISLPGLTTSYQIKHAFFRLPEPIPSTVRLRLRLSTALSTGVSVYIDNVVLVPASELYTHGVRVAAITGSSAWSNDDTATITVTNDRAGGWQEWFDRFFDMKSRRLLLPTTGSSNIPDSYLA